MILARENEAVEKKLSSLVFPGTQGGPLMHAIAGKAVALKEALEPDSNLSAARGHNASLGPDSFIQRGYKIVSGGTDNHLFLVDLSIRISPARTQMQRSAELISRSTRIPCPMTLVHRLSRGGFVLAHQPVPPEGSVRSKSHRLPTGSVMSSIKWVTRAWWTMCGHRFWSCVHDSRYMQINRQITHFCQ
ncbi:MAG: hypothetical protein CM1200mP18_16850 [Gammaproteobacteria bacterium]|nr:MAG: hypothetical protein CM1200mP18_16850 [Gammaproteobacteria bacterium]